MGLYQQIYQEKATNIETIPSESDENSARRNISILPGDKEQQQLLKVLTENQQQHKKSY